MNKNMSKSWTCNEQVINKSWASYHDKVIEQFVNKSWKSHEQIMTKSWSESIIEIFRNKSWMSWMNKSQTSHEQVINQSWTNHESNKSWTCHDQIHELSYPMGKSITEQGTAMKWFDNQGRNHEQVTSRCSSWDNSSHRRWWPYFLPRKRWGINVSA